MNREDIIKLGEQADLAADKELGMPGEFHPDWHDVRDQKFAALVAAAERTACEQACDDLLQATCQANRQQFSEHRQGVEDGIFECLEAIRARRQA